MKYHQVQMVALMSAYFSVKLVANKLKTLTRLIFTIGVALTIACGAKYRLCRWWSGGCLSV